jgi:hypothetical protein
VADQALLLSDEECVLLPAEEAPAAMTAADD